MLGREKVLKKSGNCYSKLRRNPGNIVSVRFVKLEFVRHDIFNAGLDLAECNTHVAARIKTLASLGFDERQC